MADGYYRIDLHSHAGRCFLAGIYTGEAGLRGCAAQRLDGAVIVGGEG